MATLAVLTDHQAVLSLRQLGAPWWSQPDHTPNVAHVDSRENPVRDARVGKQLLLVFTLVRLQSAKSIVQPLDKQVS